MLKAPMFREYNADFARESASAFINLGICLKEIETKDTECFGCRCAFPSEMSVFESDQKVTSTLLIMLIIDWCVLEGQTI